MTTARLVSCVGVAALLASAPRIAAAQLAGRLVVTPYVGVYATTNDIGNVDMASTDIALRSNVKQQTGFAGGANVSYWLSEYLALEGGAAYVSSNLKGWATMRDASGVRSGPIAENAHVLLGSAKLMVQLLPPFSRYNMRFGFGPAIISRGGTAYQSDEDGTFTGLTNIGGAMSLCTRVPLTSDVGIRLRAEDFVYRAKLGYKSSEPSATSIAFGSRIQNDVVFSAGLQVFMR